MVHLRRLLGGKLLGADIPWVEFRPPHWFWSASTRCPQAPQHVTSFNPVIAGCQIPRGLSSVVGRIDIGSRIQQRLYHVGLPKQTCLVKGRPAEVI